MKYYAENPMDIFNGFRKPTQPNQSGKSIHIKACFYPEKGSTEKEEEKEEIKKGKPLKAFDHFSRLVVTITENKKFVNCNIQYEKLADMIENAEYALTLNNNKIIKSMVNVKQTAPGLSKAYTFVIKTGNLNGYTPAQIMGRPDGKQTLEKQRKWLSDNLKNYPKNQEQIDAIDDALNLAAEGKLQKTETQNVEKTFRFTILKSEPLPQKRKAKNGLCPVNEIGIYYDSSKDSSPFEISISNYKVPTGNVGDDEDEEGATPVTLTDKEGKSAKLQEETKQFNLSAKEMANLIDHIKIAKEIFVNAYSTFLFREAYEADTANRKNSTSSTT